MLFVCDFYSFFTISFHPINSGCTETSALLASGYLEATVAHGTDVMTDKGFHIEDAMAERGGRQIAPPEVSQKRLNAEDTEKSRRISRLRVFVEHAVLRFRHYKFFSSKLSPGELAVVDYVAKVRV